MNRGRIKETAADAARQTIVSGIQESDLDEEEKEAVIAEIDRLVERYKSGESTTEQLGRVMPRQADGSRTWNDSVSDDDLRTFLAELNEQADAAGIPDEPFELKISEEFRQAVDRALTEG